MLEIILNDNVYNDYFWTEIFRIINESYRIDYVKYKNKNYFNCSSERYDGKKIFNKLIQNNIKPAHKDHPCNNSYIHSGECKKNTYGRKKVNSQDIQYIYSGKFEIELVENYKKFLLEQNKKIYVFIGDYFHSGDFDIDELYNYDNIHSDIPKEHYVDVELCDKNNKLNIGSRKIIADIYSSKLNPREIKFVSGKNIKIINKYGFNEDHRGLNHTLIELPFLTTVVLGKNFTLDDLIVANTNLKSHKFDYWYELYIGAEFNEYEDFIEINLNFDHGS